MYGEVGKSEPDLDRLVYYVLPGAWNPFWEETNKTGAGRGPGLEADLSLDQSKTHEAS